MPNEITPFESPDESEISLAGQEIAKQAFGTIELELDALVDTDAREAVSASAAELIETFGINPELFESKVHTLLFAAIAKRASETSPEDQRGQEFIADATMLLALKHSARYEDVKQSIESDGVNGPELLAAYDKFTDRELTRQVETAIRDGLLDGVRQRLGVTSENEDLYEVRVLDVGDEDSLQGLKPSMPADMSDDGEVKFEADDDAYEAYKATMLANLGNFAEETGMGGRIPAAWNINIDGKTVLCLPSPTAKMLLDGDAIKNRWFSRRKDEGKNSDEARLQSLVEHEYAHTQGGVALDRNVFYGMTAEEYRVENASGNQHGYLDAKVFTRQLEVLTGFDTAEYFDRNGKEASEHYYQDLASVVGIDAMLEIALVPPAQYLEDTRTMQQSANEHLGGYNGVLARLYEATKHDPSVSERMDAFKDRMQTLPIHVRESWLVGLKEGYQMPFVAELYKDIAEA